MSTPYELRQNLLHLAKNILDNKYQSRVMRYHNKVDYCRSQNKDPSSIEEPVSPTTEEIIAESEKLYRFVQKK